MPARIRNLASALLVVFAACSAKAPVSKDGTHAAADPTATASAAPSAGAPAPASMTPVAADGDMREHLLASAIVHMLEKDHLLHHRLDDAISRAAFATYMERLDGGKLFLLRSDRDALAHHADHIDDELHAGSLELAREGEKVFTARVAIVDKMVSELLASPIDLASEDFIELDAKKLELAATDAELRERWRLRLKLEVLERLEAMETPPKVDGKDGKDGKKVAPPPPPTTPIPATPEAREAKVRADLAKAYAARFARLKAPGSLDAASEEINAVTSTLDPHTDYLPPADKANFDIAMTGSLEGIGASLREHDHYIEVAELVPGGASWRQGRLGPGDLILAVGEESKDMVDVGDMRLEEVVHMIRGPKGTVVRLRVQKPSGTEETIAITRDVIVIEDAYARGAVFQKKGEPPYGYIHLPSFYGGRGSTRTASVDIRRLLGQLDARKVAGIVLDIRSNGGGLLSDAVDLTGEFIDQGPVVQVRDGHDHTEVLSDDHAGVDYKGPVVVLVDRFSASASEILAGALQDYHRAIIVGTGPTHGKGTVQTLVDLDRATGGAVELGVLKITVQQFFRVSGASTQLEGVTPDIVLPDPSGYIEGGERKLEHALPFSKIDPARHDDWTATWNLDALRSKSAVRVAKDPVFKTITGAVDVLKARMKDTRVPLARATWQARRKEQKAALDAVAPDLKARPSVFQVNPLVDPNATVIAPTPTGRTDDRIAKWSDGISHDPWIEESIAILGDARK